MKKALPRSPYKRRLGLLIGRLAANRTAVALALALLSLGGRALLLPWVPIPKPAIQDEFAYLLTGDTFASGRLTNPQHPLWIHFETVHEQMHPTYQSKYPPAQGMLLALGQVIFGDPWFGVWLSMGTLTAAIYWALAGWLPPRWALLGGLLSLTRVGFFNYWSESYWGGAVAGTAGALVIGAVPRLRRNPSAGAATILGVGLAVLANSRPFEGLVLGLVCVGAVLLKISWRKLVKPLAVILLPTVLWMLYYDYRVTGDPFLMPYQLNERQYSPWSPFMWDRHPHVPPPYNHEAIRAAWIGWAGGQRTFEHAHPWLVRLSSFLMLDYFYLGWPLTLCIAVFLLPMLLYHRRMRMAILIAFLYFAGLELETTLVPHYAAPGTALLFIFAAGSLRRLWHLSPATMTFVVVVLFYVNYLGWMKPEHRMLFDKRDFFARRDSVLRKLKESPGKQLVFVEYGSGHDVNYEWVYNRADIDGSRIVWARGMGADKDQELFSYYPDRKVWRLVDSGSGAALSELGRP
jgi:hypothetical protein